MKSKFKMSKLCLMEFLHCRRYKSWSFSEINHAKLIYHAGIRYTGIGTFIPWIANLLPLEISVPDPRMVN